MEKSRLVQRLNEPTGINSPFVFGGGMPRGGLNKEGYALLSKIFSFDYMGAAEFEYGALPKALTLIVENKSNYIFNSFKIHWKWTEYRPKEEKEGDSVVYYICNKNDEKEVKKRITKWGKGETDTLCAVLLDLSLSDIRERTKGWIELNNGFFFFADKEMWEKTIQLFEIGK